ncbi:MAG: universal stress protein [Candidatus Obscuribacterales bacterium]|nr:universal stress protein [Candidatus Obscuribacterales bacterium]
MKHNRAVRVLVAIDDSQSSMSVRRYLKTRCWPKDTEILVVSIAESSDVDPISEKRYPHSAYGASSLIRLHFLTELVEYSVAELKGDLHLDNIKSFVTEGNIADTIIKLAGTWHADEIFIGCRDKSDPLSAKRKSVSEKVLQGVNCSVTIVKERPVKRKPLGSAQAEHCDNFTEVDCCK